MLVPLYGFLRGDSLGLILLVQDDYTMDQVAAVMQQAASVRVRPAPAATVYARGQRLDPDLTVARAGLVALDRVDVVQEA